MTSDSDRLDVVFTQLMLAGLQRLNREIGYRPTRFRRMVADHGGVEAVRRLLIGRETSEGFATLWAAQRLDLSVEAHVLLPRFESLFTDSERSEARRRLVAHEFDVDAWLAGLGDQ